MITKRRLAEIIAAGVIAATISACVSAFQAGCRETPSGGYQCEGGYDTSNNVIGM